MEKFYLSVRSQILRHMKKVDMWVRLELSIGGEAERKTNKFSVLCSFEENLNTIRHLNRIWTSAASSVSHLSVVREERKVDLSGTCENCWKHNVWSISFSYFINYVSLVYENAHLSWKINGNAEQIQHATVELSWLQVQKINRLNLSEGFVVHTFCGQFESTNQYAYNKSVKWTVFITIRLTGDRGNK